MSTRILLQAETIRSMFADRQNWRQTPDGTNDTIRTGYAKKPQ